MRASGSRYHCLACEGVLFQVMIVEEPVVMVAVKCEACGTTAALTSTDEQTAACAEGGMMSVDEFQSNRRKQ